MAFVDGWSEGKGKGGEKGRRTHLPLRPSLTPNTPASWIGGLALLVLGFIATLGSRVS